MQRLTGDGLCFAHCRRDDHDHGPEAGEALRVDTGCLVALQPSVHYDIQFVGKVKTALFGGEGLFFATLQGPGGSGSSRCPSPPGGPHHEGRDRSRRKEEGSVLDAASASAA